MFDTTEEDICINFGCVEEDCRKCHSMCNIQCVNYESQNTRLNELIDLHENVRLSINKKEEY